MVRAQESPANAYARRSWPRRHHGLSPPCISPSHDLCRALPPPLPSPPPLAIDLQRNIPRYPFLNKNRDIEMNLSCPSQLRPRPAAAAFVDSPCAASCTVRVGLGQLQVKVVSGCLPVTGSEAHPAGQQRPRPGRRGDPAWQLGLAPAGAR